MPDKPTEPGATAAQPLPLLLTADQVARALGVSRRTVLRLRAAGRIPPPVRLGASVRWRRDVLLAWIDDGCPTSPIRNLEG